MIRHKAILVNVLHIRALVKANAVILFDVYGSADSRLHSVMIYHLEVSGSRRLYDVDSHRLQHNLKAKNTGLPYEFRALESIFLSVVGALEAEMTFIRNLVGGLLAELEDDIDHDKFKRLLHYSRRLTSFQNRAKLVRSVPISKFLHTSHAYIRSKRLSRKS